jgi:hypothetical protein
MGIRNKDPQGTEMICKTKRADIGQPFFILYFGEYVQIIYVTVARHTKRLVTDFSMQISAAQNIPNRATPYLVRLFFVIITY